MRRLRSGIIVTLLINLILAACGDKKTEMSDINNSLTSKHVKIPGTRLYIVPPDGFEVAASFTGLENSDSSEIHISDLTGINYYNWTSLMKKENYEKNGAIVIELTDLKVNYFPAKYFCKDDDQKGRFVELIFGDSTFTTSISAKYPAEDDKTGEEIQSAIRSIYFNRYLELDLKASAVFTLDESLAGFKLAEKSSPALYVYYPAPDSTEDDFSTFVEGPMVMVTQVPKIEYTAKDISDLFIDLMKMKGLLKGEMQNKNISAEDVNGQTAYEISFSGNISGVKELYYLLVVTGKDNAVVMQGMVSSDFDNNLAKIKKLSGTLKLK
jgi:hypothetical protein